ncbi:hypothetical protein MLGJGCBP_00255 [Rhodococcus sp. T7]|nr:hypothetical protein MLGJGCBP_10171 [Rhodococcus sp. T7]KAF0966580.1 hypothetical protein MLGJGCBP_00255 [Rhodococcus sp. T7]
MPATGCGRDHERMVAGFGRIGDRTREPRRTRQSPLQPHPGLAVTAQSGETVWDSRYTVVVAVSSPISGHPALNMRDAQVGTVPIQ